MKVNNTNVGKPCPPPPPANAPKMQETPKRPDSGIGGRHRNHPKLHK